MGHKQVQYDLDELIDIVGIGARRASSFMALGLKAASDKSINSITLESNFEIRFFPDQVDENTISEIKSNFSEWIIANGLRELDQSLALFADRLFEILLLASPTPIKLTDEILKSISRFNQQTNVAEKLSFIAKKFQVDSPFRSYMAALSLARNALTHNLGFVAPRHCNAQDALQVKWLSMEFTVGENIVSGAFEPIPVKKGETIAIQFTERTRNFPIREKVVFSPHELNELCLNYRQQAVHLAKAAEEKLKKNGVNFLSKQSKAS